MEERIKVAKLGPEKKICKIFPAMQSLHSYFPPSACSPPSSATVAMQHYLLYFLYFCTTHRCPEFQFIFENVVIIERFQNWIAE